MRRLCPLLALSLALGCAPALGWRGQSVDAHVYRSGGALRVAFSRVQSPWRATDDLGRCYAVGQRTFFDVVSLDAGLEPPFTIELRENGAVRGRVRVRRGGNLATCGGFRRCRVDLT